MEKDFLKDLNNEQREAAETIYGYLLVIAGAGTGKTRCLISRVANIISKGIDPKNILLLTFTKKAAEEMKTRVCSFPSIENGGDVTASTFHSFCAEILRIYSKAVGFENNFTILDADDAVDAIGLFSKEIREKYKNNKVVKFPSDTKIQELHSKWISNMQTLEEVCYLDMGLDPNYRDDVINILHEYNKYKKEHQMMDFEDLLYYTYQLLSKNEPIRKKLDQNYQYIMCDEYQDTNIIQDVLLDLLSKDYPNLCVVGDDFQSLYSWRGAHIENILTFAKRHQNCKTIKLIKNYRSTQEILDFANALVSHAKEGIKKDLIGFTNGKKVKFRIYEDDKALCDEIGWEIQRRILAGENPNEICIMGRNGRSTFFMESELQKRHIPYQKFGGPSFFSIAVIRDILAFLRAGDSVEDEIAWVRVLNLLPGIANKTARQIYSHIADEGISYLMSCTEKYSVHLLELYDVLGKIMGLRPTEQIEHIKEYYEKIRHKVISSKKTTENKKEEEKDKLERGLSNIDVLLSLANDYISVREMLDDFALNVPAKEEKEKSVNVTTVHSAKGLEYNIVYLINPIEGIFPKDSFDSAEEREDLRCMYVAVTRPKKELHICLAQYIQLYGRYIDAVPSHFYNYEDVLEKADHPRELENMYLNATRQVPPEYGEW